MRPANLVGEMAARTRVRRGQQSVAERQQLFLRATRLQVARCR